MSTTLPGAAEKLSAATRDLAGTRWTCGIHGRRAADEVCRCDVLGLASRDRVDHPVRPTMAASAETRS